jgi:hypothetical protein
MAVHPTRASSAPAVIVDRTPIRARWTAGSHAEELPPGVPDTSQDAEMADPQSTRWPATVVEARFSTPYANAASTTKSPTTSAARDLRMTRVCAYSKRGRRWSLRNMPCGSSSRRIAMKSSARG